MLNVKISNLEQIGTLAADDCLPIVDTDAEVTRKVTIGQLDARYAGDGGGGITSLSGDVVAVGPGAAAATVVRIDGEEIVGHTGTGSIVFNDSPELATPDLGVPTAGVLTNCTGLPLGSGVVGQLPAANGGLPPGFVGYTAGSSAPDGWLIRDGSAVSRTTYAALFAVIGTTFGSGDGSTTFNVPDGRAEFDRGLDLGRGVDTDRTLGSSQASQIGSHTHGVGTFAADTVNAPHSHPSLTISPANAPHSHPITDPGHEHEVATSAPGSGSPRPSRVVGPSAGPYATTSSPTGISATNSATAPHNHAGSADAANAPHGHPISGTSAYVGGTSNPVSPAPTPAPTVQGETRPRNVAYTPIIKT